MENKFVRQNVIDNFICTMDTAYPISVHLMNAVRDAGIYKWNKHTLETLVKNIKEKYRGLR